MLPYADLAYHQGIQCATCNYLRPVANFIAGHPLSSHTVFTACYTPPVAEISRHDGLVLKRLASLPFLPICALLCLSDVDAYAFSGQERRSATRAEIERGNPLHPLQWQTGTLGYAD